MRARARVCMRVRPSAAVFIPVCPSLPVFCPFVSACFSFCLTLSPTLPLSVSVSSCLSRLFLAVCLFQRTCVQLFTRTVSHNFPRVFLSSGSLISFPARSVCPTTLLSVRPSCQSFRPSLRLSTVCPFICLSVCLSRNQHLCRHDMCSLRSVTFSRCKISQHVCKHGCVFCDMCASMGVCSATCVQAWVCVLRHVCKHGCVFCDMCASMGVCSATCVQAWVWSATCVQGWVCVLRHVCKHGCVFCNMCAKMGVLQHGWNLHVTMTVMCHHGCTV